MQGYYDQLISSSGILVPINWLSRERFLVKRLRSPLSSQMIQSTAFSVLPSNRWLSITSSHRCSTPSVRACSINQYSPSGSLSGYCTRRSWQNPSEHSGYRRQCSRWCLYLWWSRQYKLRLASDLPTSFLCHLLPIPYGKVRLLC